MTPPRRGRGTTGQTSGAIFHASTARRGPGNSSEESGSEGFRLAASVTRPVR